MTGTDRRPPKAPPRGVHEASAGLFLVTLALAAGCSPPAHLAVAHRHSPGSEARIVVLPVGVPAGVADAGQGRTLAKLYATELLKSYEVLDYERFRAELAARNESIDSLLAGSAESAAEALDLDAILRGEVYRWSPGKPGFWLLGREGQVGFQAQLVDVRSGSVLWSVNRVRATRPEDTLLVGLAAVFRDLAAEMPRALTPY